MFLVLTAFPDIINQENFPLYKKYIESLKKYLSVLEVVKIV